MNRFKEPFFSFVLRALIVFGWMGLIFGLLYLPHFLPKTTARLTKKSIDIFCWPDMFLPETLAEFEAQTGIKVIRHYYTTNEEMLIKLKATKGQGYDLVIPSDYAVKPLIAHRLLKPLDHSKFLYAHTLHPRLIGHDYDPTLAYSLPFQWDIFAFGVNCDGFQGDLTELSWSHIFEENKLDGSIAMTFDPVEAISFASYYLFDHADYLNEAQKTAVLNLLKTQKKWVDNYSALRGDYFLATKNCRLAVCLSSHLFRSSLNYPHTRIVIPRDRQIVSIENVAIPVGSKKDDLVYQFLNFIYTPKTMAKDCTAFLVFPATIDALPLIDAPPSFKDIFTQSLKNPRCFAFVKPVLKEQEARDLWIKTRSFWVDGGVKKKTKRAPFCHTKKIPTQQPEAAHG